MKKLTILGSGAWGTALASVLGRNFPETVVWSYLAQEAQDINDHHMNSKYLGGVVLKNVKATTSIEEAMKDADIVLSVVPSFAIRESWKQIKTTKPEDQIFINASKGIEKETHLLPSQLYSELFGNTDHYFSMCGPSFAHDVAEGKPTAIDFAGKNKTEAEKIIKAFKNETFHLRYSDDVIGTELGAVVKNVIAIASGMVIWQMDWET
jgi:glycerol-3-phosphate dehydrogenase (NAD(P)+)